MAFTAWVQQTAAGQRGLIHIRMLCYGVTAPEVAVHTEISSGWSQSVLKQLLIPRRLGCAFRAPLLPSQVARKPALPSVSPDMKSGDWLCFVPALIQLGHDRELSGRGSEHVCDLRNQAEQGWGVRD